jgi:hypothetical protein
VTTVPLGESASVKANGSGNAIARVGPLSAREIWHPSNVHVNASSATNEAVCQIYVGDNNTLSFRDNTFTGSTGDSSDRINADTIKCGQYVWAMWSGGDPGALFMITVTGSREI